MVYLFCFKWISLIVVWFFLSEKEMPVQYTPPKTNNIAPENQAKVGTNAFPIEIHSLKLRVRT